MRKTLSPADRFARALSGHSERIGAREWGVMCTYQSILCRHQCSAPLKDVPPAVRAQCIRDYAWMLTLTRLSPDGEAKQTQLELEKVLYEKYPQLRAA